MGGCKCSYRECKESSDSKTHFFHYPVQDSKRCRNWIINARRPEFEDLTPSQIRNRVICQHHFKENMFMNFKHNKLVHNAVPTEDGPHMKSSNESIKENLIYRPKYATRSVDLPTSNKEATTLIVNESPFNGYTFLEPDNKLQRSSKNYVELLTRKQDGLLEIARRRMVENLNSTIKKSHSRKHTKNEARFSVKKFKRQTTPHKELRSTMRPDSAITSIKKSANVEVDNIISKKHEAVKSEINTKEATTLIVNESPFNGYTFLEQDNKLQITSENCVEFLPRKQDGLLEIARRRMVKNLNSTMKNTHLRKQRKNEARFSVKKFNGQIKPLKELCSTMRPDNAMTSIIKSAEVKVDNIINLKHEAVESEINTNQSEIKQSAEPKKRLRSSETRKTIPSSKLIKIIMDEKLPSNEKPFLKPPVRRSPVNSESSFNVVPAVSAKKYSSSDLYHKLDSAQAQLLLLPTLQHEVKKLPTTDTKDIILNSPTDSTNLKLSWNNTNKVVTLQKDAPVYNAVEVPVVFTDLEDKDKNSTLLLKSNNVKCQNENHLNIHIVEPMTVPEGLKPNNNKTIYNKMDEDISADVIVNNNLIEKIEQNSREIAELKNLILNGCETIVSNNKKRIIVRRQSTEEETRKVELYEEISKYLSRQVSSLVHNELFPRKRRNC